MVLKRRGHAMPQGTILLSQEAEGEGGTMGKSLYYAFHKTEWMSEQGKQA